MVRDTFENSPQTYARIGGILYLFIIVAAGFGEIAVRGNLIVWGDPARTAHNIMASETMFRLGLAGEMLTCVCDVILAMILYVLLKPVSKNLALLGSFFRLTFIGIYGVTKLFEIAALVALDDARHFSNMDTQHFESLAYLALKVHSLGYGVSFLFFGMCCVVFGYLIAKSRYLPRLIGMMLLISGVGYVVFSLSQIVAPTFTARNLFPWLILPAFVAELALALWLTLKGVDAQKWSENLSHT